METGKGKEEELKAGCEFSYWWGKEERHGGGDKRAHRVELEMWKCGS